jgi:hypothetical protein
MNSTPLYSGVDRKAQSLGTRPQFNYLQVVQPQIGTRLFVFDPQTSNFAFVDATAVGPSGAPLTSTSG